MARLARIVIPTVTHHVTQRGNERQQTFFSDADYRFYLKLLSGHCSQAGVDIEGWCLMPNHVHLVLAPLYEDGLRRALSRGIELTPGASTPGRSGPEISGRCGSAVSP